MTKIFSLKIIFQNVNKVKKILISFNCFSEYIYIKKTPRRRASDVGVNLCNAKSCKARQTKGFSKIIETISLVLIFLSTHAQL